MFNETEAHILRLVQTSLPDSATPYADIATEVGTTENVVLDLLRRLRESGAIRRFGASIKHQKAGWNHNAMVAWIVAPEAADAAGEQAAAHANVSHCYLRPSSAADWPYTLYTMVHGRSEAECHAVIQELCQRTGLAQYAMLNSLKELKKTSMLYF